MRISVITATYNSGKTLRNTIESILSQTYTNIEYIIVDGLSKDNTLDIIKEYEPKFKGKMHWISEKDKGLYDAMNKGINMATGDIIGILNSDDFYTSNSILEQVAQTLSDQSIDAVYGDIHFVKDPDLTKCIRYYSSKGFSRWQMRLGFMPAHPSFYCRKKIYDKYGGFDCSFKVAADFEHLLRLIFVNKITTKYIPTDFVTMRTGGVSTSGIASHKQILHDHLKAYRKNNVTSNIILESIRYFYKIVEIFAQKIKK